METLCKYSAFILLVLVCGCPKEPRAVDPPSGGTAIEAAHPEGDLERRCFDGDPEACDQLGH